MSDDKIIDRIKKLRAQAESASKIGSEAEAQAFAALMQRMMVEHKVREDQLKDPEKKPEPIVEMWWDGLASNDPSRPEKIRHANRIEWAESLARVVAQAHYCRIMVRTGDKFWTEQIEYKKKNNIKFTKEDEEQYLEWGTASVCFVGRKSDAEAALIAFGAMVEAASAFGRKEYFIAYQAHRKGEIPWQRGFYRSYLLGFAARLGERYREELGHIEEELRQLEKPDQKLIGGEPADPSAPCSALVRIAKDAFDAIDEHFDLKRKAGGLGSAKRVGVGVGNYDAYNRGRAAADKIKLRPDKKIGGGAKGLLS